MQETSNIYTNNPSKGLFVNRKDLYNYSGIYKITNIITGKIYIGSSLNLYDRLIQHRNNLRINRHENNYLQLSYNKYGEENFRFTILEKFTKLKDNYFRDFILLKEQFYFDRLCNLNNNFRKFSYNIRPCSWDATGCKLTSQAKLRIKNERIINPLRSKKCYQYNKNNELICIYKSVADCCRENNFTNSKLQKACRNNTYYKNYFWSYNENFLFNNLEINCVFKNKIKQLKGIKIFLKETNEYFECINDFCRKYKFHKSKVSRALQGKTIINNFTISYAEH